MNQTNEKEASLLEENIKLSQAIFEQNKKIKRRLNFILVGDYLRLALILIPLIIGAIYLPPLIREAVGPYQELFHGGTGTNRGSTAGDGGNFNFKQFQELLKEFKSQ